MLSIVINNSSTCVILNSLFLRIAITMYITTRNTLHENRANTTKHPNRAPTVAPVLVLARLLEVELAMVFEEEPESLSVTEVRLAELGVVVKEVLVVKTEELGVE